MDLKNEMFLSVINNDYNSLEILLKTGLSPNVQNELGDTPIILAILYDQIEMIRMLLYYDANINIKNKFGKDANYYAKIYKYDLQMSNRGKFNSLLFYFKNFNFKNILWY